MPFPGGKSLNGVLQWIINQIPPHDTYIEAFLGGGAVLRRKRPASQSFGIDNSIEVVRKWHGNEVPALELHCCDAIEWLKHFFGLFRVHQLQESRLDGARPAESCRTFIYFDPPYLSSTCRSIRSPYEHPFSVDDHRRLLDLICQLPANVMISGYSSPLYEEALKDWRVCKRIVSTRSNDPAIECLWMNYSEPSELHDYSFVGSDKRERERIRRRLHAVSRKLRELSGLERMALQQSLSSGELIWQAGR